MFLSKSDNDTMHEGNICNRVEVRDTYVFGINFLFNTMFVSKKNVTFSFDLKQTILRLIKFNIYVTR